MTCVTVVIINGRGDLLAKLRRTSLPQCRYQ